MNKKKTILRKCVLLNKSFNSNELVKFTYVKSDNKVRLNITNQYKGRSIYFNKEKIEQIDFKNINKIINKKFKVLVDETELDILRNFLNKEK